MKSKVLFDDTIHHRTTRNGYPAQPIIEKPQLCIFGVGRSSIEDQMQYSDCRLNDLISLNDITYNGITLSIIPRFFVADYPARAFEAGQQIGGAYSCPCGIPSNSHQNLSEAISTPVPSLEIHENLVKQGILWKTKQTGILKGATKAQIIEENRKRSLYVGTCYQRPNKDILLKDLSNTLHGAHRLPALTINSALSIKDVAPKLELANAEFLHDFLGVMENLIEELPFHEPKLKDLFTPYKANHERMSGIDARFCAVKFAEFAVSNELDSKFSKLAQALVELSQICYSYSEHRTPRQVLRLSNLSFLIGLLLKEIVGPLPKKISANRFYGIHYHGLTSHIGELGRIVAVRSLIPEQEEATFHRLKQYTMNSSSRHSQHVVDNGMLRIQFQPPNKRQIYQHSLLTRKSNQVIVACAKCQFKWPMAFLWHTIILNWDMRQIWLQPYLAKTMHMYL